MVPVCLCQQIIKLRLCHRHFYCKKLLCKFWSTSGSKEKRSDPDLGCGKIIPTDPRIWIRHSGDTYRYDTYILSSYDILNVPVPGIYFLHVMHWLVCVSMRVLVPIMLMPPPTNWNPNFVNQHVVTIRMCTKELLDNEGQFFFPQS